MTTGQKYVDGPDSAQTSSSAVQTPPSTAQKPPNPFEQWQAQFLRQLADDYQSRYNLFEIIEVVRELEETTDPTEGICLLLGEFLTQHRGDLGRHKYELAAVVRVIGCINALKEAFICFDNETDYIDQYETALQRKKGGQSHE